MKSVLELVKNTKSRFKYFRDNELWYEIVGTSFLFPVPVSDVGIATFLAEDKSVIMMKWIRSYRDKLIEDNTGV